MVKAAANFRLAQSDIAAMVSLAPPGGAMVDGLRSLLPSAPMRLAYLFGRKTGDAGTAGYREWIEQLAAAEMRRLMIEDPEFPIAAWFLPAWKGAEYTATMYLDFLAARDELHGFRLTGLFEKLTETKPSRLVPIPEGGEFERQNVRGWVLLRPGETITADTITTKGAEPAKDGASNE